MADDLLAPLRAVTAADPGRLALQAAGRRPASHAQLLAMVEAAAAALNAAGVEPGSRVATILPNAAETAVAILSVASCAACVPVNPELPAAEMAAVLERAAVTHVLAPAGDGALRRLAEDGGLGLIELSPDPHGPAGAFRLSRARPGECPAQQSGAGAGRIALVLHTSGSTGSPKRVPLSVANLSASARSVAGSLGLGAGDVCLSMMPMFHIGALVDLMLAPLGAGGSVAFAGAISTPAFLAGLAAFAPTWSQAVPTVLRDMLAHEATREDLARMRRLRFIRAVSQPLPPKLHADFEARFGVALVPMFGMTETAGLIASTPLGKARPGSVGQPFGAQVMIADARGNPLSAGGRGEVLVSGPGVMAGYEGDGAGQGAPFAGRWLKTGDEGYLDADGYLFLTGRIKDVINRGGEKISPAEIDLLLADHPDVREAAAFPLPHPTLGEEVAVAVVRAPGAVLGEHEIVDCLRGRIAGFKLPRHVLFVDRLPRVPSGKLDRRALPALSGGALAARPRTEPRSDLARTLAGLWRRVLEVEDVFMEDDFFELGGDSLRATSLALLLEERFGSDLPVAELFDMPTLAGMADALDRRIATAAGEGLDPEIYRSLTRLMAGWQGRRRPGSLVVGRNTLGGKRPLYWIPQSLHGFEAIADRLDPDRPIYAMPTLSYTGRRTPENTARLARYYAGEIAAIQPQGPYLLSGFCQGGLVAFEVAKALRSAGREVALLAMQDRFVREPYDGEVALFWAKRGATSAYAMNSRPELLWAKYYSGPVSVFFSDADHHELHNPPFVDTFVRQLEDELARVEAGLRSDRAMRLRPLTPLEPGRLPARVKTGLSRFPRQGCALTLQVSVTNTGPSEWRPTRESGIVAASRWRVPRGEYPIVTDTAAALAGPVPPGGTIRLDLPVRVPMRCGPVTFEIEIMEDGAYSSEGRPTAHFSRLVFPIPPRLGDIGFGVSARSGPAAP